MPGNVVQALDRGGVAAYAHSSLVDTLLHCWQFLRWNVEVRGDPAVGESSGEVKHLRTSTPDPDTDGVFGRRSRVHTMKGVETTIEVRCTLIAPHEPDDGDGFLERGDGFARLARGATYSCNGLPEATCAQAKLDAATTHEIERGSSFGQDGGRAQWQIGNIGEHAHPRGLHGDCGSDGPGVEKS